MGGPEPLSSGEDLINGALLAFIGGFMDGFTYFGHGHVFANAMTGNVVLLSVYGFGREWNQSLRHLPPIITFLIGIWAARAMLLPVMHKVFRYPRVSVVLVEVVILGVISGLPGGTRDFWITTSVAFVASMQIETFRVVNGHSFNSTFTTGNLRSLSEALFDWAFERKVVGSRDRVGVFAVICITFFLGAMAGGTGVAHFGNSAMLVDVALLLVLLRRLWLQRPGVGSNVL